MGVHASFFSFFFFFFLSLQVLFDMFSREGPSDDAAMEILYVSAQRMEETCAMLGEVERYKKYVNTEGFEDLDKHGAELDKLRGTHASQKKAILLWDEKLEKLLVAYEKSVASLSGLLLKCDTLISELELVHKREHQGQKE
jgi:hypothetical protein